MDNLHLSPFNRNRVLRNVEAFVRENVKDNVEGMIVAWNRSLKIRRKFTNDGRDLSDVLKQIEDESALGQQILSERRDVIQAIDDSTTADQAAGRVRTYCQSLDNDLTFTIDAMKTTINQLAGVEGRKILIHVSDGLPQSPGAELWKYISDKYRDADESDHVALRVRSDDEVPFRRAGGERLGRVDLHDRRVGSHGRFERLGREPHARPSASTRSSSETTSRRC